MNNVLEDQFWQFILERENIRLRRLAGWPRNEWTNDPIFQTFSFTNVKREHDRTTTLLKREFYDKFASLHGRGNHADPTSLLNATLFRFFGTIEAARAIGWQDKWTKDGEEAILDQIEMRRSRGEKMFTGAYIIPTGGHSGSKSEVVTRVADGVWSNAGWILNSLSWEEVCKNLKTQWCVGSFMAKEILLDYILATNWTPDDWQTWTPVGPGGARGAARVRYGSLTKMSEHEALNVIREIYSHRAERWPDNYVDLDLTDIQFQLCEFDKYNRVAEGRRPKHNFRPTIDDVTKQ